MTAAADYIIVGAGTAGCVLANRLSADPACRVLLVEAGPCDRSWMLQMPAGLRSVFKRANAYTQWFETAPQAGLDGRRVAHPRGCTLGGSSAINGMTFLRGHAGDFDGWAAAGCTGWSFRDCLPAFKRVETTVHGDPRYRGRAGPVGVRRQDRLSALNAAFLQAGREAGHPASDDPNGAQQEGFARFDMSVWRGRRSSAARAYLHPAADRPNLTLSLGRRVRRVAIENGRAAGVEVDTEDGPRVWRAQREVLLCGGAFASPHLLLLSGIGPGDELRRHGLPVHAALPGVGGNLQDHLETHVQVRSDEPVSLNRELRPHRLVWAGLQWALCKRGLAAANQCHVGAFLRSRREVVQPDVQFHFFPVYFGDSWLPEPGANGYRLGAGPVRPTSRGRLRLHSADPHAAPAIDPHYLATEDDRTTMRAAVRLALDTLRQPAFRPYHAGFTEPAGEVTSDADLDAFIRRRATTAYHPCGTCAMGAPAAREAVVDPQLRVRGIAGLRVIDASVMPRIVSANLNAAVFMIAERAAEFIRGAPPA